MADWIIREEEGGSAELWKGRKRIGAHVSVGAAERKVETLMDEGDHVIHEAPDGYRSTLKGRRRGWRQPR